MRTARLLPVSPSMHCSQGMHLVLGGVPGPGWVYLVPGGYLPRYSPTLWTEFFTHASENITLPQTSFAGGNKKAFQPNGNCPLMDKIEHVQGSLRPWVVGGGNSIVWGSLGQTNTTENITFPKLHWRTVIRKLPNTCTIINRAVYLGGQFSF